jgi:hypothetical protein
MAHYKRKRCRYQGKSRRDSTSFLRVRLGLKPVILPTWDQIRAGAAYGSPEYQAAWQAYYQRKDWPDWYSWYGGNQEPRWWTILEHTRPRRARDRAMERKVLNGRVDADEAIWPLSKKPHIYYW